VNALFQKLHPGERYYLTNIQAFGLMPSNVRQWSDDLWLFPYYTNRSFVPQDARQGNPASVAWPGETGSDASSPIGPAEVGWFTWHWLAAGGALLLAAVALLEWRRRHRRRLALRWPQ
jgi:hypothetical protein